MRLAKWSVLLLLVTGNMLAQTGNDALSLLDRITKHYREAESVHLEATIRADSHNEYEDGTRRSVLSAYVASGGRFRYEGRDASGSSFIVSDGTTEWRFLHSFAEFAKAPAGTYFGSPIFMQGDDRSIVDARYLLQGITSLDANLRSAHFLSPERVEVGGRKVKCTVVHFGTEDSTRNPVPGGSTSDTTIWIDPASLTVLKQRLVSHTKFMYGSRTPPFAQSTDFVTTTTYSVVEFDFAPDPGTFVFHAPTGSSEVAKLPSAGLTNNTRAESDRQAAAKKHAELFVGKPLPSIILHNASGAEVPIARYRGHPLLIDVWATWCGPCLSELPALQKIRVSTSQTDLAIIAIDEDYKTSDTAQFLQRRGYNWPDFHYSADLVKRLGVEEIPVTILTNAEGKVVYYHSGAEDVKGLAAAIASLGEEYHNVSIN